MSVRVTFHGAAGTVTGSRYLIETDDSSVLIDCGLFQGKKELRQRNWDAPGFEASHLSAVIITHAHIDHTGYLPRLVKAGFNGPIFCTPATADLIRLLLVDSARLQEEEAEFANRHGTSRHHPAKPLYDSVDAEETLKLLRTIPRNQWTQIRPDISVKPTCAGHILGACSLTIEAAKKRLTFSGDIGRYGVPILPDPQPVEIGELLVCESTYGDRDHPGENRARFGEVLKNAMKRGGPIIIPAFALGRTQDLLYYVAELEREGTIPAVPVYIDSPMAVDATKIYHKYQNDFDEDAAELISRGERPLATEQTNYCRSVEDSKKLNFAKGSRIIISASGMVNGGRVMHHMKHWLPKEEATVLFVGYQAEETRGRTILRGASEVKIFGEFVPIRAHIEEISGLSAHGDRKELIRWLRSSSGAPRFTKITHGEPEAAEAFTKLVTDEFRWLASPAIHGETVEL